MHPLQGVSFLGTPLQGGILKPPALRVVDDFLLTACEFVSDTAEDASHGRGDHRPLLDDARTIVVSCTAVALGTTEAARASFTGTATPDRALVLVTTVKCGATLNRS
jgi:hypothetical protein